MSTELLASPRRSTRLSQESKDTVRSASHGAAGSDVVITGTKGGAVKRKTSNESTQEGGKRAKKALKRTWTYQIKLEIMQRGVGRGRGGTMEKQWTILSDTVEGQVISKIPTIAALKRWVVRQVTETQLLTQSEVEALKLNVGHRLDLRHTPSDFFGDNDVVHTLSAPDNKKTVFLWARFERAEDDDDERADERANQRAGGTGRAVRGKGRTGGKGGGKGGKSVHRTHGLNNNDKDNILRELKTKYKTKYSEQEYEVWAFAVSADPEMYDTERTPDDLPGWKRIQERRRAEAEGAYIPPLGDGRGARGRQQQQQQQQQPPWNPWSMQGAPAWMAPPWQQQQGWYPQQAMGAGNAAAGAVGAGAPIYPGGVVGAAAPLPPGGGAAELKVKMVKDFKVDGVVKLYRGDILVNTGKKLPDGRSKLTRAGVKYKVKDAYFCDYVSSDDGESGDDTEEEEDDGLSEDDEEDDGV